METKTEKYTILDNYDIDTIKKALDYYINNYDMGIISFDTANELKDYFDTIHNAKILT